MTLTDQSTGIREGEELDAAQIDRPAGGVDPEERAAGFDKRRPTPEPQGPPC